MRERVARSRELVAEGYPLRRWRVSPGSAARRSTGCRRRGRCRSGGRSPIRSSRRSSRGARPTRPTATGWSRVRPAQARRRGQPQAGAAGDAGAEADPAPPPARAAQAARLLPGRAATAAVAARHDLDLGRRARLDYLNAIIDCCTREIVAWQLELRCRADEAIAVVERAAAVHGIQPGELDARLATTAPPSPPAASAHGSPSSGSRHRRGGYRDPEARPSSRAGSGNSKNGRSG